MEVGKFISEQYMARGSEKELDEGVSQFMKDQAREAVVDVTERLNQLSVLSSKYHQDETPRDFREAVVQIVADTVGVDKDTLMSEDSPSHPFDQLENAQLSPDVEMDGTEMSYAHCISQDEDVPHRSPSPSPARSVPRLPTSSSTSSQSDTYQNAWGACGIACAMRSSEGPPVQKEIRGFNPAIISALGVASDFSGFLKEDEGLMAYKQFVASWRRMEMCCFDREHSEFGQEDERLMVYHGVTDGMGTIEDSDDELLARRHFGFFEEDEGLKADHGVADDMSEEDTGNEANDGVLEKGYVVVHSEDLV